MQKLIEVNAAKEFASTFFGDPILKMAVNAVLDRAPAATDNNVGSKWIPVTERLPEEADRYLCNIKSFAFPGSFYQRILKYDKGGFIEDHIYTDDVTHWMALPEPPKGD